MNPMRRAGAMLATLSLVTGVDAQTCSEAVQLVELDAGPTAPQLATPDGAPIVGSRFSVQVRTGKAALAGQVGELVWSQHLAPATLPDGTTVFPGTPQKVVPFVFDANGASPSLLVTDPVTSQQCGLGAVIQARFEDANGVVVWTDAVQIRAGEVQGPVFAERRYVGMEQMTLAHVDDDGVLDLVGASEGVSYRLGNGDATFGPAVQLSTTPRVEALLVADLDGDGELDIANAHGGNEIELHFSTDGAGFAPPTSLPTAKRPTGIAATDLELDGDVDLVTGILTDLSVRYGEGGGAFKKERIFPTLASTRTVRAGDLDGDGFDEVTIASGDQLALHENNAGQLDLAFSTLPVQADHHVLADLDLDGDLDVLATSESTLSLTIARGNGDGTFGAASEVELGSNPTQAPTAVTTADVDLDGLPDVLVTLANPFGFIDTSRFVLLLAKPDGTLSNAATPVAGNNPLAIAAADLDDDGDVDVVLGNPELFFPGYDIVPSVSVVRGEPGASFERATASSSVTTYYRQLILADADGDGLLDAYGRSPSQLFVHRGIGSGGFSGLVTSAFGDFDEIEIGDLDGNGTIDVVAPISKNNRVRLYRGMADGKLELAKKLKTGGLPVPDVLLGDFTNDGLVDLFGIVRDVPDARVWPGDGTVDGFSGPDPIVTPIGPSLVGVGSTSAASGDLDGDGDLDVVTSDVAILLSNGDGTFVETRRDDANGAGVVLHDFDQDGTLDIATVQYVELPVLIRGNGDGTFGPLESLPERISPQTAPKDVTGDGVPDFAGIGYLGDLEVVPGARQGLLGEPRRFAASASTTSIAIGDLDGDGLNDVLVGGNLELFTLKSTIGE